MALLIPFNGIHPQVDPTAWLAPNATLIGDVRVGPDGNLWLLTDHDPGQLLRLEPVD